MNFLAKLSGSEQPGSGGEASGGNESGAGLGGWFSSLKEKSKDLVEVYKRDLGEFAAVVKKDTTDVVEKTKESLEKNASGLLSHAKGGVAAGGLSVVSGGSTGSNLSKLEAMQADRNSYVTDPPQADAYAKFLETFNAEERTAEISQLLETCVPLATFHNDLVPEKVSYKQYWSRYFFRYNAIKQEEERKKAILKASELFGDDEDFAWDEDDTEREEKGAGEREAAAQHDTTIAPP
eukprot:CAMPEP_0181301226 /NCGR_PEP_ID=MMETSP1101-20121128/7308_1 /TAXON_ID=46948 /ORGANISM="Rhodomonas abbreviata, Strain Caron Lab Isolate" /LENGTH=235 /DNA_ID=CAMNT_0023406511 /DNA_START=71 /DNA_END=774 /DNA_ORIENTATION=+